MGTYRLLLGFVAEHNIGYYSENEFDLSAIRKLSGEKLELGRSCDEVRYRDNRPFSSARHGKAPDEIQEALLPGAGPDGNFLIVSNHCSYLDILVIGGAMPSVFVSKEEVASWFILGWLARLAGTVFVDRKSRSATVKAVEEASTRLRNGASIVVFPEAS